MPSDFKNLLLFQTLGKFANVNFCSPNECDLFIYGPYFRESKKIKYYPKFLRKYLISPYPWNRKLKPITMFYSCENLRWNIYETDFSISSDLGVNKPTHYRLPYWMECLDWSHFNLNDRENIRYGDLVQINSLINGIQKKDLNTKQNRIIFFASHLKEPRKTLLNILSRLHDVDCYGPIFNVNIEDHNKSGFFKKDLIKNYKFSFCPENSIYPGYVTEKIPEAYASKSIPITWIDPNFSYDFQSDSVINLFNDASSNYDNTENLIDDYISNKKYEIPLLKDKPCLNKFFEFIRNIISQC